MAYQLAASGFSQRLAARVASAAALAQDGAEAGAPLLADMTLPSPGAPTAEDHNST
jgi:hypothetical protein